jgi:hypothetical protein
MKLTFWDLLGESIIVQSIITIAVLGVWLYLIATQAFVPDVLTNIVGLVVGFFFGGKYALAMKNASTQAAVAVTAAAQKPPEPPPCQ